MSTINCLNGGRGRLGPIVTATGVMLCTMVAYPLLNYIPIASLAGVMIVVVLHTFKWAKLPMVVGAFMPASCRPHVNRFLECRCYPKWLRLPEEIDCWEASHAGRTQPHKRHGRSDERYDERWMTGACCVCVGEVSWRPVVNRQALILVVVSILTIWLNLAYAVGVGLVLAAVRFAYSSSLDTK